MAGENGLDRVEEGTLPCRDLANQEHIDVVNPSILGQLVGLDLILQLVINLDNSFLLVCIFFPYLLGSWVFVWRKLPPGVLKKCQLCNLIFTCLLLFKVEGTGDLFLSTNKFLKKIKIRVCASIL